MRFLSQARAGSDGDFSVYTETKKITESLEASNGPEEIPIRVPVLKSLEPDYQVIRISCELCVDHNAENHSTCPRFRQVRQRLYPFYHQKNVPASA